jgi:hypothetical protein
LRERKTIKALSQLLIKNPGFWLSSKTETESIRKTWVLSKQPREEECSRYGVIPNIGLRGVTELNSFKKNVFSEDLLDLRWISRLQRKKIVQ